MLGLEDNSLQMSSHYVEIIQLGRREYGPRFWSEKREIWLTYAGILWMCGVNLVTNKEHRKPKLCSKNANRRMWASDDMWREENTVLRVLALEFDLAPRYLHDCKSKLTSLNLSFLVSEMGTCLSASQSGRNGIVGMQCSPHFSVLHVVNTQQIIKVPILGTFITSTFVTSAFAEWCMLFQILIYSTVSCR